VKIGIGYIHFENRLSGLMQFFTIHNNAEIIATARNNCKFHLASLQSPDGFHRQVTKG
jgi:hypothetical protein